MPDIINLAQPISDRSDPRLLPYTRSGGAAMNGTEQIISPQSSVWKWTAYLPIHNAGTARSWRLTRVLLEGRWNYLRTRVCDRYRMTRRDIGANYPGDQVPYSDGALHSDGTGFKLAQPNAPILSHAVRGATSIVISANEIGGALSAGLFFSINDRLYVVTGWEEDGDEYALTFKPPLRAAVEEGDTADFDAKALWQLDTDDEGKADLRIGRFAIVQINMTEPLGML